MNVLSSGIRLSFALAIVSTFQVSSLGVYCDYAGDYLSLQLLCFFAILEQIDESLTNRFWISMNHGVVH